MDHFQFSQVATTSFWSELLAIWTAHLLSAAFKFHQYGNNISKIILPPEEFRKQWQFIGENLYLNKQKFGIILDFNALLIFLTKASYIHNSFAKLTVWQFIILRLKWSVTALKADHQTVVCAAVDGSISRYKYKWTSW